jgi:hypothetical protein
VTQVNGIAIWAEGIKAELAQRLPRQRKTQRDKLAVLVATMLHVRSANLVEVAAGLPRASDRWDINGFRGFWQMAWCAAMTSWRRSPARSWLGWPRPGRRSR